MLTLSKKQVSSKSGKKGVDYENKIHADRQYIPFDPVDP